MSRKLIYILVILTTIVLVIYNAYEEEKQTNNSLEPQDELIITDEYIYNGIENNFVFPITIKNYQNDEKNITYTYKIKLSDISGAYKYEHNGKESYLVFSANGEAQVTLNSNESITIYDLPSEISYEIEQLNDISSEYTTESNGTNTTIAKGTVSYETIITFDNKTIIKEEEKPSKNPYTKSISIISFIIMCIISVFILYKFGHLRIKKYE